MSIHSKCMYTKGLTIDYMRKDSCNFWPNITEQSILNAVKYNNDYYGSILPSGSRIIYPNGEIDPWSVLGVLEVPPNSNDIFTLWVPGASHHAWTHPSDPNEQSTITKARKIIQNQVQMVKRTTRYNYTKRNS